jgi:hypothetical protein
MNDLSGYTITPYLRMNGGELEQRWDNHSGDDRPAQVWVPVPEAAGEATPNPADDV